MTMAWLLAGVMLACAPCGGGESGAVPQSELNALDRAIARELNSSNLGSQVLGDLMRLRNRLAKMPAATAAAPAPEQTDGDDSQTRLLQRLEAEARSGGRAAMRSLALYRMYLNEPEKALAEWRRMGPATEYDVSHMLVAAYLELALGEYDAGKRNLETALRRMETRTSLSLSTPVFCQTIAGYRIYVERPQGGVLPGEDVLVYVEIEGAEFTATPERESVCDLMFGLKLKNEAQHTLWAEPNYGEYSPVFNGPIRDLHTALTWRVPNDLEPGRYYLHVEAVEDSTKRRGESILGFNVGRRETNPERRPTGIGMPDMPQSLYDAQKAFPGVTMPSVPALRNPENPKAREFELLQDYYRGQKVE